jgi:hypothetical protein
MMDKNSIEINNKLIQPKIKLFSESSDKYSIKNVHSVAWDNSGNVYYIIVEYSENMLMTFDKDRNLFVNGHNNIFGEII